METETLHWSSQLFAISLTLADLFIRLGLCVRVIMRQRQYGVTLAWLVVILLLPFFGAFVYLFFGENRIGERRGKRAEGALGHYQHWLTSLRHISPVDWESLTPELAPIHKQANRLVGIPAMDSNSLELIEEPTQIINSIIKDINAAQSTCHLQFYIWYEGGTTDEVADAVIHAAARGVTCRILVDSIGSKDFLQGEQIKRLRENGVRVIESLPAGFFKALFVRIDIRNHRKIVVIDGEIAYTGSQNMVDPRFFKQDSGVGQWIDTMVRIKGP
ncbi:MAG: cardiolipin synthase, partial [Desulfocapsa sp.]